ncbi:MAG: hypothetical protein ACYC5M_06205 [Anaerolineae bacterium]
MSKTWWENRPLRVYYPIMSVDALAHVDVRAFVSECVLTDAEAIVLDLIVGGALYPSQVQPSHPLLHLTPGQDPVGEIATLAHAYGLRVLAGVDWSLADEATYAAHSEWFQHDAEGHPTRQGAWYVTCPLSGYRNADVALPALRELISRYSVDGLVIRGVDPRNPCRCPSCLAAFGASIPNAPGEDPEVWQRFSAWYRESIRDQLDTYSAVARQAQPNALMLVEPADTQDADWICAESDSLPVVLGTMRHVIIPAPQGKVAGRWRWWASLATEQARAAAPTRRPLVRIESALPGSTVGAAPEASETALRAYQALAHGAGVLLSSPSVPGLSADSPATQAIRDILGFVRDQHAVLDLGVPIVQVSLLWPETAVEQACAGDRSELDALRAELMGLYASLSARHVLFDILPDALGPSDLLSHREAIVVPAVSWVSESRARQLAAFARAGGRLILLDSVAGSAEALRPLPRPLAALVGGTWGTDARRTPFAVTAAHPAPGLPQGIETLTLSQAFRVGHADQSAMVWLCGAESAEVSAQGDPLVMSRTVEEGTVVYAAMGLGQMALESGAADHALLLEAMVQHGSIVKPLLTTDAPDTVEVTLAHWAQGVVVHMVGELAQAALGPIELSLAWDGPAVAHLHAPGKRALPLLCEEGWNRVRIIVPLLEAYAQVVVRSA